MNVSWRYMLAAGAMASAAAAALSSAQGQVVATPSFQIGGTNSGASGNSSGCCAGCCNAPNQHIVRTPGVAVPAPNVFQAGGSAALGSNTLIIDGARRDVTSSLGYSGGYGGQTIILGGGGGGYLTEPLAPSVLNNLDVTGGEGLVTRTITENVPVTEDICIDPPELAGGLRPVQAICLDDKGAPHPASQVFDDRIVDADYSGEVYRCMAGTSMQVTLGALDGDVERFDGGQIISCAKGEALVHSSGGKLSCAPQAPRRNCNERSLLRRYGPGVKLVSGGPAACIPSQRTVMKSVTREVQVKAPSEAGSLILDGGVGQFSY